MTELEKIKESAQYIKSQIGSFKPEIAIVLGSGLGELADEIENPVVLEYKKIPRFPVSTVPGHKGRLVFGKLGGKDIVAMQGRFHTYEGYMMREVVYPIRTFKVLGIENLLLTNAAGCVNASWNAGDLMLITDHIKLASDNPCRGENMDELGPRFFDMSTAYDKSLCALARDVAREKGITLREGVYMLFTGPSFETPAEVRLARILGADAVGMSTVPEAIAASHMGMRTLAFSCLTNMASGILDRKLNHEEVLETGERVKDSFQALVKEVVRRW
ncbi:MAG TPA: purine-nucleoside phosphorylase [Candidatus Ornithospirochaeta avicola]|uniref:Purine nucleoside phosphorylase n=1 Tax=Candidatus Ornithospirochaeta avicola TaxID=2840896 RepID=A0A9D1TN25_9SPIO|nr:purine-nucleoside phosphorylase [Candidatus Ornithospirochaeta avicola]